VQFWLAAELAAAGGGITAPAGPMMVSLAPGHSGPFMSNQLMKRREFIGAAIAGAAGLGLRGEEARAALAAAPASRPVLMNVGHQHDHSDATLRLLAAFGVNHICSGMPSPRMDENWTVAGLTRLRKKVESYGISLDAVPLPMS